MIDARVSQKELAAFFGVSPRTVRRWTDEGLPRESDGTYRTPECIAWRLAQLQEAPERSNGVPPGAESKDRYLAAKALKLELEVAEKRGSLIPLDLYVDHISELAHRIRAKLIAVPLRWSTDVVGIENDAEGQVVLDRIVREVLEELRETGAEMAADHGAGGLPDDGSD